MLTGKGEQQEFGPYILLEKVATGGMAEIYLAKTQGVAGFEKYLCLKVILPDFADDDEFIQMLIDEAKIAVGLNHVNIAQIFDLGRVGDTYFIAMEYVDGADLFRIMRNLSEQDVDVPADVAAYVVQELCTGLDYAHRKRDTDGTPLGIIHRDISPQNILISRAGEVKIIDFGIAKAARRSRHTQAGVIKGKYYYMSPEQAWGKPLDHRSDIFSAGIILYEVLTGQMLYLEEDMTVLLEMVRRAAIPPPTTRRRDIPPALERIVMKALARRPEDRWATAHDFQVALTSFLYSHAPDFTPSRVSGLLERAIGAEGDEDTSAEAGKRPATFVIDEEDDAVLMSRGEYQPPPSHSVIFSLEQFEAQFGDGGEDQGEATQVSAMPEMDLDQLGPPLPDIPTDDYRAWGEDDDPTTVSPKSAGFTPGSGDGFDATTPGSSPAPADEVVVSGPLPDLDSQPPIAGGLTPEPTVDLTPPRGSHAALPARPERPGGRAWERRSDSGQRPAPDKAPYTSPKPVSAPWPARSTPGSEQRSASDSAPGRSPTPARPAPADPGASGRYSPPGPPPAARSGSYHAPPPQPSRSGAPLWPQVGSAPSEANPLAGHATSDLEHEFTSRRQRCRRRRTILAVALVTVVLGMVGAGAFLLVLSGAETKVAIEVDSVPSGATVLFDGEQLDRPAPVVVQLTDPRSAHRVEVVLPNYKKWSQKVTVPEGYDRLKVLAVLSPVYGKLMVRSTPAGADLYVNDEHQGKTPLTVENLQTNRELKLELKLPGYQSATRTLQWKGRTNMRADVPLVKLGHSR